MRMPRPTAALLALAGAAIVMTGCAGSPSATPTTGGTQSAGVPSSPVATPGPTGSADAADEPTCETIIPTSTVNDFASLGWTAKQDPFYVGQTALNGGLQCTWGDYSVPSDHVQVFGWAPITADQANLARSDLLSSGWRQVDDSGRTYITENSDTAVAVDDQGYGMTYLFGDGWVKVADTKQGLLLVEWPPH